MRISTIYTRAAKLIAENKEPFCCTALRAVLENNLGVPYKKSTYENYFEDVFRPARKSSDASWFGDRTELQNQVARTLALLFMIEIIKDEAVS
jgi:hypothetical protein